MKTRLLWPSKTTAPKRLSWLVLFPRQRAMDILVLDALLAVILVFLVGFVGSTSERGFQLIADSMDLIWLLALATAIVAVVCLFRLAQAQWPVHARPWERDSDSPPPG